MLEEYSDALSCSSCNDWEFPIDWTLQDKQEFVKAAHEWNGDPEEYDKDNLRMPDFFVASYLSHLLTPLF